jgi:RNA polymerase sigma factor (sigma-70 family)
MQFLKQIESLFRTGTAGGLSDGQLLERFLERHGEDAEAAFAALVDRHGAMVLRICRQTLRDEHDAEDAAQATFLVLARRASSISRRQSLGCWLHGVALRVAAKARAAATRRRTHERRGGAIRIAGHGVESEVAAIENQDDWARLHDELGQLPQTFREPLILCYLDGLSQEQAAAQLRCPLGTIQSRLARGRAKLKARLEKRGVGLPAAFPGANQLGGLPSCPAPTAWCEATVRLGMHFAEGKGQAIAGAGTASVALAEEVVRALAVAKMKLAVGMIFSVALLVSGAAAWAMRERETRAPAVVTNTELVAAHAESPVAPEKPQPPQADEVRTIRGIVRDEQGRPVARAWIGDGVRLSEDVWSIFEPLDRIRERKEPFRDAQGNVVPAGALGKYFELRDQAGNWRPLDPADVRRYRKPVMPAGLPPLPPEFLPLSEQTIAAIENGKEVFEVRTAERRLIMDSFDSNRSSPHRTDAEGRFSFERHLLILGGTPIHFATADFSQEALAVVHGDDPDAPLEITLRPLREARGRVILKSNIKLQGDLWCSAYTIDPTVGKLDWLPAIFARGQFWANGAVSDPVTTEADTQLRQLEFHLPRGKYKVVFQSDIVYRVLDMDIPAGNGPIVLPDIELEPLAWVRMLGKPAAEPEAVDLDGKPAVLADYRGKVVVLVFWSTENERRSQLIARLADIQKRFKGRPLVILALHDTSLTSLESLREAVGPLTKQVAGEIPVRFLLDRAPVAKDDGRNTLFDVEFGSGRTREIYETWGNEQIFVIDQHGKLVFATGFSRDDGHLFFLSKDGKLVFSDEFSPSESNLETEWRVGTLAIALEDQFGLPRSPLPKPARANHPPDENKRRVVFKGKVVDHDGKPVVGAKVASLNDIKWKNAVRTGPSGEFALDTAISWHFVSIKVEAAGFATDAFGLDLRTDPKDEPRSETDLRVEPSGLIREPLGLDPGVEVTGRVLKDGKPVAGVLMALRAGKARRFEPPPPELGSQPGKITTDANGSFRFPHVPPQQDWRAYAKLGSLPDGGVIIPVGFRTTANGTSVDIGELHVEKGRALAGRIVCSDGKAVPGGLLLTAYSEEMEDSKLEQPVGPTGQFRLSGLLDGRVTLNVIFPNGAVRYPYRLSDKNRCLDPQASDRFEGRLDHDITDLTILLEPGMQPEREFLRSQLDQTALADFEDAKAGPITGVSPRP